MHVIVIEILLLNLERIIAKILFTPHTNFYINLTGIKWRFYVSPGCNFLFSLRHIFAATQIAKYESRKLLKKIDIINTRILLHASLRLAFFFFNVNKYRSLMVKIVNSLQHTFYFKKCYEQRRRQKYSTFCFACEEQKTIVCFWFNI